MDPRIVRVSPYVSNPNLAQPYTVDTRRPREPLPEFVPAVPGAKPFYLATPFKKPPKKRKSLAERQAENQARESAIIHAEAGARILTETLIPPPPPPEPDAPNTLPKNAVFNVLRAIMPEEQAKKLAGISPATNVSKPSVRKYEGTVSEIRDKIQNDPDLGFLKQLQFYKEVRDDVDHKIGDRISAAKQIDAIVGNNAPQRVEVSERRTLVAAVQMVHKISGESGMSPLQLKQMLSAGMQAGQQIVQEEVVDESPAAPQP